MNNAYMSDLHARIEKQVRAYEEVHGDKPFKYDRRGVREGIAAIEDESWELWHEWDENKRSMNNIGTRTGIANEALDVAACAMLVYAAAVDGENEIIYNDNTRE